MRAIDADALKDVIQQHDYPLADRLNSVDNGMFTLGIFQAIDEQPTLSPDDVRPVGKWISVEERLPHYLDHVLCINKFGIQMVGYLTDYKEGGFRCESGMDSCDYITHWMPLPEPPKEETE